MIHGLPPYNRGFNREFQRAYRSGLIFNTPGAVPKLNVVPDTLAPADGRYERWDNDRLSGAARPPKKKTKKKRRALPPTPTADGVGAGDGQSADGDATAKPKPTSKGLRAANKTKCRNKKRGDRKTNGAAGAAADSRETRAAATGEDEVDRGETRKGEGKWSSSMGDGSGGDGDGDSGTIQLPRQAAVDDGLAERR